MIVAFTGQMGSGKTLSLTRMVKEYSDKGMRILSNIKFSFPHEHLSLDILSDYANHSEQFQDCVVVIDEAHVFLDSRRSISGRNVIISYFLTQTRKRNVKLFITTQHFGQVEKRLRQNVDVLIECTSFKTKEGLIIVRNKWVSHSKTKQEQFVGNDYFNLYDTSEIVSF